MRDLRKNKQVIWYANQTGTVPIYKKDKAGNVLIDDLTGEKIETGDSVKVYEKPVKTKINVSAGKSDADADLFGINVSYDRVLCTTNLNLPITETTLIWKETVPVMKDDGTVDITSADYRVSASPLRGLDNMLIAISRNKKRGDGSNA